MLKKSIAIALVVIPLLPFVQASDNAKALRWHDACALTVEGKGWTNTANFFDRYPAKAREMVRPPVWELSEDSAGMCVRFVTDATEIAARWVLRKDFSMSHMAASGVSGLDLQVKEKGQWRWVAIGRPCPQPILTNEAVLVCGLRPIRREFALYLPLYNGVKSVAIGVAAAAQFKAAPVHGEFIIEVRRGGDPAPLLLSPMLGKLLVHEKCDFSDGASSGQAGRSLGNWRDPSRSR